MADNLQIKGVVARWRGIDYTIPVVTPPIEIPDDFRELRVNWSFSSMEILNEIKRAHPTPPEFKDAEEAGRWLDRYASRT